MTKQTASVSCANDAAMRKWPNGSIFCLHARVEWDAASGFYRRHLCARMKWRYHTEHYCFCQRFDWPEAACTQCG